jgi:DNA-binding beta-propeller fold protein YncE
MTNASSSQFYVVGGTVNPDSPSYVVRRADQELYDRLLAGEFCYVLTSRQMGKSSLMARTARRLREEAHIHTAIVDLTTIGTERDKLSAEQWYYGIAYRILREVGLRDANLSEWWQARSQLPALQRLTDFFRDLLLERVAGQTVIFIDEIDSTISLPFTDDFFAAIRACHNARATDAAYNRLSFVLLGVASPSDLVKDATRTPFNVGQRIELTDFTAAEAQPLAAGLSVNGQGGEQTLARILDWTGGHPYLTQKLCGAMQHPDREEGAHADIDALVEQSFLSQTASRDDSNLNFVRDWMKGDKKLGVKVFKLYRSVRRGKRVTDAPRSPIQNHLKLSGVVTLRPDRTLQVRNRVYERVFTDQWARKATPVDWNRRLAVASAAMLLLSIGFWYGVLKPRQYIGPLQTALNDYPGTYYDALRRYPWYAGKANELMAQFWERRALHHDGGGRDEALLERLQALAFNPNESRRKEAALLIGNDYPNLIFTLRHGYTVSTVAYSPDGKRVLTGSYKTARQWDGLTGQPLGEPLRHEASVLAVAFNLDGEHVLTGSEDGTVRQWDAHTSQPLGKPLHCTCDEVLAVAFSPDGKRVLTGSGGTFFGKDEAHLWDAQTGQPLSKPLRHQLPVSAVAFSPDGKRMLTKGGSIHYREEVYLWNSQTGQPLGKPLRNTDSVSAVAFSPDGNRVLIGSRDGTVRQWDTQTSQPLDKPLHCTCGEVLAVAFSPDGNRVLIGSRDGTVRQWDARTGQPLGKPLQHDAAVSAVAYSPDGKRVLTGSEDGTVRQWDAQINQHTKVLQDDPAELLRDWQRRLGLKFDPGQNHKLVPLYPVESSRTTASPFN